MKRLMVICALVSCGRWAHPTCEELYPPECDVLLAHPARADNCLHHDFTAPLEPVVDFGEGTLSHGGTSPCGDGGMTFISVDNRQVHLMVRSVGGDDNPHWSEPLVLGEDGQAAELTLTTVDGEITGFTVLDRFENLVVTNQDLSEYAAWGRQLGLRCSDCSYPDESMQVAWEATTFSFDDVAVEPHTEAPVNSLSGLRTFRNIRARVWTVTPDCPGGCPPLPWEYLLYQP